MVISMVMSRLESPTFQSGASIFLEDLIAPEEWRKDIKVWPQLASSHVELVKMQ